jgi:hypothetical protein
MKTTYVLIDHENVQPKDLAVLAPMPVEVIVFLGVNQNRLSTDLVTEMQALGAKGRYVRCSGNGSNALDFHIAFHLGELAAREPQAAFIVVSKDTGFDPLLTFMRAKGIAVQRVVALQELVPLDEGKVGRVIECLQRMLKSRPGSRKALGSAIGTFFAADPLPPGEVDRLIDELLRRKCVSVKTGGKLAYSLPV